MAVAVGDASPLLARGLGDSVICVQSDGAKTVSNHSRWLRTRLLSWLTVFGQNPLRETSIHFEGLLFA